MRKVMEQVASFVVVLMAAFASNAWAQAPRQVIQAGPTGAIAVSKQGFAAVVDGRSTLHLYDLASRTLVRSIARATLEDGAGLVHPINPVWDDATGEVLLGRGGDQLAVSIDGTRKTRPHNTSRLWPVGGGGKARWISRLYGDAEVLDGSFARIGTLASSGSIAAAADGKSAILATATSLVRYTLDPVAKQQTIAMPMPPLRSMMGQRIALSSDGRTAAVCLNSGTKTQAMIVHDLDTTPKLVPIAWPDLIGCEVALAELHGIVVVAAIGQLRGFDLATGAQRWEAPRDYGINQGTDGSIAIHGRTLLVSWRGLVMIDVVRGDLIGQVGTDIDVPGDIWFLRGDQLLTARTRDGSLFGPPVIALSTWSLKTGTRSAAGTAAWGHWSHVGEDGALTTLRIPKADKQNTCWTFARGTTGDGAPAGQASPGRWPPAPNQGRAVCLSGKAQIVGVDLAGGALAVHDQGKDQVVRVTGTPVTLDPTKGASAAIQLRFSPDGKWIAGGGFWGSWASLYVWDTRTGSRRWFSASPGDPETEVLGAVSPRKGYRAHAFSPDSQQLAVAGSDAVTVYALPVKRPIRSFTVPQAVLTSVAFAGATVIAGTLDGQLAISRGNQLATAASTGGAIDRIVVRADGKRAATISDDGAIRIWDLAKPALLATLVEATDGESFASTPNGAYAGGREAAAQLGWIFEGPTEGFAFERFAGQLARPDIVAKRLSDATTDLAATIARPPRVTLAKQSPPNANKVQLGLRVESTSGKPGSLRVFVNGRQQVSAAVDTTGRDVTIDVPLESGSNVVTLVAFDDAGRSSNPKSVDISMPPATARPDVWIIAAGVGWYPNLPVDDQLEGSVNDAYAIADLVGTLLPGAVPAL